MKAIIYCSNSGFTKKYAEILGKETGLPVYDVKAKTPLEKSDDVIFMGWTMAGSIKGYSKALKKYDIKAVCAVGMSPVDNQKQIDDFTKKYDFSGKTFFYLQGGYDYSKLHGIYKFMMGFVTKSQDDGKEKSPEEKMYTEMVKNGFDNVSVDNLKDVKAYINDEKQSGKIYDGK